MGQWNCKKVGKHNIPNAKDRKEVFRQKNIKQPPPPPKSESSHLSEYEKVIKNAEAENAYHIFVNDQIYFQKDSTVVRIPDQLEPRGLKEAINSCYIPSTIVVTPPLNDDESKDNRSNSSFVTIESTADRSEKWKNSIDKKKLVNTKIKNFKIL